jgi:hypothetical protein
VSIENESLSEVIFQISGKLIKSDKYSTRICEDCLNSLVIAKTIRNICIDTEESLGKYLQDFEVAENLDEELLEEEAEESMIDDDYNAEIQEPVTTIFEDVIPDQPAQEIIPDDPLDSKDIFDQNPWWAFHDQPEKSPEEPLQPRYHPCSLCGKVLHRGSLAAHERSHFKSVGEERRFECDLCDKKFSECPWKPYYCLLPLINFIPFSEVYSDMKKHIEGGHLKLRNHFCSLCGKGFYRRDVYESHMKVHMEIFDYTCSDCGKSFLTNGQLKVGLLSVL